MLRPYQASDGRWLQFNMIRNEELLSLLLAAMEAIELLADSRFSDMEAMWIHRQLLAMNCKHVSAAKLPTSG